MDKKRQILKNWKTVIILSAILFTVVLGQDIVREVVLFQNDLDDLNTILTDEIKGDIKQEVEYRVSELELLYENLDDEYDDHIENGLRSLEFTIEESLVLMDGELDSVVEAQIIQTILHFDDVDGEHDYYLMNIDGTLILNGETDETVNVDIMDSTDDFSRLYIQEMIDDIEDNSIGHAHAFFGGVSKSTMGYIGLRIEGTDYILYSVAEINHYLNVLLEEYYLDLSEFYSTKDGAVYVLNLDGLVHLHKNPEIMGLDRDTIENPYIVDTINYILTQSADKPIGFIEYEYYADSINGDTTTRISYIHVIEELGIIVGYSADKELNDAIVSDFVNESLRKNLQLLIPVYLILSVITVVITKKIITNTRMSTQMFQEEEQLYETFSDITEDIILITDKKGNILFTNKLALKIIYKDGSMSKLNLDDIMFDEEGYKVMIGIEKNYYIKSSVSKVMFDGEESDLYIIKDVTEKVETERKLEQMTLIDDLTGLGNRRMLVRDYKDFILPHVQEGNNGYLSMIDLDNFKQANDVYGHSFGDDVLINIGKIFRDHMDEDVKIYRVGGDEFSLLAINKSQNEILQLLRKLKNKISTFKYGKQVNLGFSAGVIEVNVKDSKRRLSDYYEKADSLLYLAKEEGKDRIKI